MPTSRCTLRSRAPPGTRIATVRSSSRPPFPPSPSPFTQACYEANSPTHTSDSCAFPRSRNGSASPALIRPSLSPTSPRSDSSEDGVDAGAAHELLQKEYLKTPDRMRKTVGTMAGQASSEATEVRGSEDEETTGELDPSAGSDRAWSDKVAVKSVQWCIDHA